MFGKYEITYQLVQMGFKLHATEATYAFLMKHDVPCELLHWPTNPHAQPNCFDMIKDGNIDMVINLPNDYSKRLEDNYIIRRAAVDYNVPLLNNAVSAKMFVEAMEHNLQGEGFVRPESMFEHYESNK